MSELRDRFRSLDRISAPDLWAEVEERAAAIAPEPLEKVRGAAPWPAGFPLSPRLVVAVVLLLVAVAVGLVVAGSWLLDRQPRLPLELTQGTTGRVTYSIDGDVYIADGDGSNPVLVADGVPSQDGFYRPLWSPDGRFVVYFGQGEQSYIVDASGRNAVELDGYCSAWSPDSTMVACITGFGPAPAGDRGDRGGPSIGILLTTIDGSVRQRIDLPQGWRLGNIVRAFWSPDGRSIVLSRLFGPGVQAEDPDGGRTWLITLDGGEPQPFPVEPAYGSRGFFSPDGSRVAGVVSGGLVVAAEDGSDRQTLLARDVSTGAEAVSIAWSPSGDRIALEYNGALSVVEVETGTLRELWLPQGRVSGDVTYAGYVVGWSAEGDRILFETSAPGSEGLWSVRADGSERLRLASGQPNGGSWQHLHSAPGSPAPAGS